MCVCVWYSVYQVVVEEERPRRSRRAAEILRCYPIPIHFQNASVLNSQYYFTAEFPAGRIQSPLPFTVGDNHTYDGYWNLPLLPHKSYSIYYQAVSTANGVRGQTTPSGKPQQSLKHTEITQSQNSAHLTLNTSVFQCEPHH